MSMITFKICASILAIAFTVAFVTVVAKELKDYVKGSGDGSHKEDKYE